MADKDKKKKVEEVEEKIDAMGQESELKAAKWVIEEFDKAQQKEEKEKDETLERLSEKRKSPKIFTYTEEVSILLANLLKDEEFPKNWHWRISIPKKTRVRLDVFSKEGKHFARGFEITGEPRYDFNAALEFSVWAGDKILREEETKNGEIILP